MSGEKYLGKESYELDREAIARALGFHDAESMPWRWVSVIMDVSHAAERRGWERGYSEAKCR